MLGALSHYWDYHNPLAVEAGNVHKAEAGTEWLGASLRHEFAVEAGATVTFHCVIGVIESVAEARKLMTKSLAPGEVERRFASRTQLPATPFTLNRQRAIRPLDERLASH